MPQVEQQAVVPVVPKAQHPHRASAHPARVVVGVVVHRMKRQPPRPHLRRAVEPVMRSHRPPTQQHHNGQPT